MPKAKVPAVSTVVRTGDQAEYFAQYLLSHLGKSVLIPRQEDHGVDFLCTLNSAPANRQPEFLNSFYFQVKVGAPAEVEIGGSTKSAWRRGRIHWLYNLDIPFLLAFVDIAKRTITICQTSTRWLSYYDSERPILPYKIIFQPSQSIAEHKPRKARKINPTHEHDGKCWRIDLGKPIATIALRDIDNPKRLVQLKALLIDYIDMERRSGAHRIFGSQWGLWVSRPRTLGKPFDRAWVVENEKFPRRDAAFYQNFGRALMSLIFRLKAAEDKAGLKEASALFCRYEKRFALQPNLRALLNGVLV